MKLSSRLSTLRNYFHQAKSIWDIGCDHGLLGLSFLNEDVDSINLVDPASAVIENLKKKLKDTYIPKGDLSLNLHHKKGQDITLGPEKKLVFIAGMGGKEIQQILTHLEPLCSYEDRIVISPHRKILELRRYLSQSSWRLIDEQVLYEDGQYYQVLCLGKGSALPSVSLYGDEIWRKGEGPAYKKHQVGAFEGHKDELSCAYFAYLKGL